MKKLRGLTEDQVFQSRRLHGENTVTHGKTVSLPKRIADAFINPFTLVLVTLAIVSAFTDIIMAEPGEANPVTVSIITTMVLISGLLRLIQETRSGNAAAKLNDMIITTACVERFESGKQERSMDDIVVGDIIHISAGDMIPADARIITSKDLFISQSALTGESEPIEKTTAADTSLTSTDAPNLLFMGSNVISGTAAAVVIAVGNDTMLGQIAKKLTKKPAPTSFDKGVNSVSWVLIRFMLVMVPIVLFINGMTKGDWMDALLFAISVAVGLTPEMLPMIVTTCLAKGAMTMAKEKVIIKNLNAIQNLGSMDILCTDKTGTLTQDKVVLEYHLDVTGREDSRVLRHAFLNSYFQTGLKNLMDIAIIDHTRALAETDSQVADIAERYHKVDEIPFDFERRCMSVVVADANEKTQMITKGAIEEMLRISSYVEYNGCVVELTNAMKQLVLRNVDVLNKKGMRVLGIAQKTNPSPIGTFSIADETHMVLIGYLAFWDSPKETTAAAVQALQKAGVAVKILTGDNEKVTQCICHQVNLHVDAILLGSDIITMDDAALSQAVEETTIFAKLSPTEKERVVTVLRTNGHSVGYMGDGINDSVALKAADVGISVDTAVDIAKESADVILLEKDLMILEKGLVEGRRIYANMIKYIKMTASSNFGNMFSVLIASAFLPFLPMSAIHLILLNMIYDISCTAIPWDNVDADYVTVPRKWDAHSISRFMINLGPISSIFDITTYLLMYFIICPSMCGGTYHTLDASSQQLFVSIFQTGWFIESMWSQTLVIHMLRTPKLPFFRSHASWQVTVLTFTGILLLTLIPFTSLGRAIGLHSLSVPYFICLVGTITAYMALATLKKNAYIAKYGELL